MNKKQDLTAEQKHILYEEGTEAPGSSSLNNGVMMGKRI